MPTKPRRVGLATFVGRPRSQFKLKCKRPTASIYRMVSKSGMTKFMDGRKTKWRAPKRRRWNESDGRVLLAAVKASALSDGAFAREHGIGRHRIDYWRKRLPAEKQAGFVPIEVTDVAVRPAPTRRVELELRGGARLVFRGSWDVESIAPWLDVLGRVS